MSRSSNTSRLTGSEHAYSSSLVTHVANWLIGEALKDVEIERLVTGCCERLQATGIPLVRGYFTFPVLHPLLAAIGVTWLRGKGTTVIGHPHVPGGVSETFQRSPHYYMLERDLDIMRVRLDCPNRNYNFPIFEELIDEGITDYLAFTVDFSATGPAKLVDGKPSHSGMLGSWATDRSSGFSDSEIDALLRIQDRLAVASKIAIKSQLMGNVANTYLGKEAGARVLGGQIKRGDGQSIEAAIWYCDLRGSTAMADQLPAQDYIDNLNSYFDATGGAVQDAGGEILSFIGDGMLAIFQRTANEKDLSQAARRADEAARDACARMDKLNAQRTKSRLPVLGYGLGLHVGTVMYGNVGVPERLTFSIFGAAVNEVARLESLTKQLGEPILVSEAFACCIGRPYRALGTYDLHGVQEALSVLALDTDPAKAA